MTGQQADIQWYIAREGKQHGPLSDVEMRTFVAQGHLKPTDLIWRPGFADWRPAPAVFPFQQPEPPAAAPRPTTQGSARRAGTRAGAAAGAAAPDHSFEPNRIRVAQGSDDSGKSRATRALALVALLALIGGGGWYAWTERRRRQAERPGLLGQGRRAGADRRRRPTARHRRRLHPPAKRRGSGCPAGFGRRRRRRRPAARYQVREDGGVERRQARVPRLVRPAAAPGGRSYRRRTSPSTRSTSISPRRSSPCAASTPTRRCPPAPNG